MLRWIPGRDTHYDATVHRAVSVLTRPFRASSSIRGVLVGGFAIVFGLWLVSGYDLVRRLHAVERRTAAEHQAALRGQRLLSTVRTNVLLGSIYLRDAIIDNRSSVADSYRQELDAIRAEVERLLPAYVVEVTSQEERQVWAQLQTELDAFWKSREIAFSPDGPLGATEAASILRRRVVPSRNTILQIIDRLSELQALSERRHEAEVSALYAELQNRLVFSGVLAMIVGLVVAVMATHHVSRLEQQIDRQRAGERQTRQELERLSARLVTVQEEERRHLARELHDEVGQALTAIKMDVAVALRATDVLRRLENGARVASWLEDARSITENTLQNVRDLSQLLHPSMLDDFGLPEALRSHLRAFSTRTGIHTQFEQHGMEARLSPEVEVCVYRIVQEALTNVARHSGARNAIVTLSQTDGALDATIEDDGHGVRLVRSAPDATRGLGVIGMRERTQALGGTFLMEPREGGGTRVAVHLPAVCRPANRADIPPAELLAG